jgi:WD repeat-containing protein 45
MHAQHGLRESSQVRLELMDRRDFRLINAHNTQVTAIALSLSGIRLATASEKGTLIRVFETTNGSKLQELRRGSDPADVYHLAFDRKSHWLAVTSDKNTVHVFAVSEKGDGESRPPPRMARGRARAGQLRGSPTETSSGPANPGSWFTIAQVHFFSCCQLLSAWVHSIDVLAGTGHYP